MSEKTAAAVLAAGTGSRFEGELPKQFITLGGRPVIDYSVRTFSAVPAIDFLYVVVAEEYREYAERLREACGWKVTRILIGGADRSGSTLAALRAAEQDGADRLLLHDAARPLVTEHTILSVCEALEQVSAATAAVPATDTIAVSDGVRRLCYTPDRQTLWHVQTPQGFSVGLLRRAYERKEQLALSAATDDCGLVRSCFPEVPIALADGSRQAMKLTYPEDLYLLETLLRIH